MEPDRCLHSMARWSLCTTALLLAFLLTLTKGLQAQQASANINGTITDPTGAVVEGTTITLIDTATGVSPSTVSNATGNYVFVDVHPAAYALKVVKPGCNTTSAPQSTTEVKQTATLNSTL